MDAHLNDIFRRFMTLSALRIIEAKHGNLTQKLIKAE